MIISYISTQNILLTLLIQIKNEIIFLEKNLFYLKMHNKRLNKPNLIKLIKNRLISLKKYYMYISTRIKKYDKSKNRYRSK